MITIGSMSELTVLHVAVPSELAEEVEGEIGALVNRLCDGYVANASAGEEPFAVLTPAQARQLGDSRRLPAWDASLEHEEGRLRWVVEQLTDTAFDLVVAQARRPRGATTAQLAADIGVERSSIPALLRAISAFCRRVRRRPLWHWCEQDDGPGYATLDEDQQKLLAVVLEEFVPGWDLETEHPGAEVYMN